MTKILTWWRPEVSCCLTADLALNPPIGGYCIKYPNSHFPCPNYSYSLILVEKKITNKAHQSHFLPQSPGKWQLMSIYYGEGEFPFLLCKHKLPFGWVRGRKAPGQPLLHLTLPVKARHLVHELSRCPKQSARYLERLMTFVYFSLGDSGSGPILRFPFKCRVIFPLQERAAGSGGHKCLTSHK